MTTHNTFTWQNKGLVLYCFPSGSCFYSSSFFCMYLLRHRLAALTFFFDHLITDLSSQVCRMQLLKSFHGASRAVAGIHLQRLPAASEDLQHLQPTISDGELIDTVCRGGGCCCFVPSFLELRAPRPAELNEMFTWSRVWEPGPICCL